MVRDLRTCARLHDPGADLPRAFGKAPQRFSRTDLDACRHLRPRHRPARVAIDRAPHGVGAREQLITRALSDPHTDPTPQRGQVEESVWLRHRVQRSGQFGPAVIAWMTMLPACTSAPDTVPALIWVHRSLHRSAYSGLAPSAARNATHKRCTASA